MSAAVPATVTPSPAEAAIAREIAAAREAGRPLVIRGNGTKLGMLRPVQAAREVSTRDLTGIPLYAPKELVLTARAGTAVAEIERRLAAEGQHLIAEPPDLAALLGGTGLASIGGTVATNLSGPRRVAWGAMRDHVLGIRAVTGAGELIRSGGRVLKNVTGLDLCKLYTGSHGTLGVITEVTLKVLPAPERTGTLALSGLTPRQAVAALAAALGSPFSVSAAAYLPDSAATRAGLAAATALIRIEESAASVAYRTAKLRDQLAGDFGQAAILDDAASRPLWRAIRDARVLDAEGAAVWRVSVRPSRGPDVVEAVVGAVEANCFLDWGGGLVWIAAEASEAAHGAVTAAARAAGGTWMLLRAPDALRAAVDVLPPEPPALAAITRRVKAALDPAGILNPGRMYSHL
jgi:glycolate oxidase FAD binding subunit